MVKVQKRDGTKEDYDRKKLLTSFVRAQLPPEQAQSILTNLEAWISSLNQPVIKSSELRNKVIELMESVNSEAADIYKIYRKSRSQINKEV